jgi:phosphate transport system ATP-binding protein
MTHPPGHDTPHHVPPVRRIVPHLKPTVVEPPTPEPGPAERTAAVGAAGAATQGLVAAPPDGSAAVPRDGAASLGAQPSQVRQASAAAPVERMHLESVWLAYGDRWVVRDVTLPVRQGEVLALIGASGSGKTTLLRSLNRLTEITAGAARAGSITLDGDEIDGLEVNDLRRRVSMVFQQPNPFPMSVFENVAYPLREERSARRRRRRAGLRGKGPSRVELREAVVGALKRAGLYEEVGDDLDRPALRLSGGQQQRLCIARSLAARPEVLLLDEPCSALDPISTATIEELIVGLRESVAVVIVTHNLQQAMRVADHVAFMHLGELVEYGTSEQVFAEPRQQRTREYVSGAFG